MPVGLMITSTLDWAAIRLVPGKLGAPGGPNGVNAIVLLPRWNMKKAPNPFLMKKKALLLISVESAHQGNGVPI
jgi:hypothetical protein